LVDPFSVRIFDRTSALLSLKGIVSFCGKQYGVKSYRWHYRAWRSMTLRPVFRERNISLGIYLMSTGPIGLAVLNI